MIQSTQPPKLSISSLVPRAIAFAVILSLALIVTKSQAAIANNIPYTEKSIRCQLLDTNKKTLAEVWKNIEPYGPKDRRMYCVLLDGLTKEEIVETIALWKNIPVVYRNKSLFKRPADSIGGICLNDRIESLITSLKFLNIYVLYDGEKLIAQE